MNYFDLHCDTITECYKAHRELAKNNLALDLERTAAYQSWAQVFAVWTPDEQRGEAAYNGFHDVAEFFHEQVQKNSSSTVFCRTRKDLKEAAAAGKRAALLSIEGAGALAGNLEHLYDAKQLGVCLITLTWNGHCEAGDGCGVPNAGGLTPFGFDLIREMEKLNIIIDVSHLSEKGFWDVAHRTSKPFVASHSDAKSVCPHQRNLTDDQFRVIIERNGLVGINLCGKFLAPRDPKAEDVLRHVDHFLNLGGESVLAVGSDLDGCVMASGIHAVDEMGILYHLLEKEFGKEIADRIFWENAFRFFTEQLD
ncbi:MAG: Peptidase M19 [Thermocaproicibacter melissae]|jgi:membrane dipeptidase|uniref:dipeptidase n=1 Tax=Thermocaproicibacter melissae TaxID=2966552 RepID=UPI003A0FFFEB